MNKNELVSKALDNLNAKIFERRIGILPLDHTLIIKRIEDTIDEAILAGHSEKECEDMLDRIIDVLICENSASCEAVEEAIEEVTEDFAEEAVDAEQDNCY